MPCSGDQRAAKKKQPTACQKPPHLTPTSPHPRRRLLEIKRSCAKLTSELVQKIGQCSFRHSDRRSRPSVSSPPPPSASRRSPAPPTAAASSPDRSANPQSKTATAHTAERSTADQGDVATSELSRLSVSASRRENPPPPATALGPRIGVIDAILEYDRGVPPCSGIRPSESGSG